MKQFEMFKKEVMEQICWCPVKLAFINLEEIKNTCLKENKCSLIKNCMMCFLNETERKGFIKCP